MAEVNIYYLEIADRAQHQKTPPNPGLRVVEAEVAQGKVNRFLYDLIGEPWQWYEKREWTIEQWEAYAGADEVRTFIAYVKGSIAGYFELRKINNDTELAYFGLSPSFVGQGFGSAFLSHAIDTAWDWPHTDRVIVNTCSLDHPSALGNYKKRGFSVYEEKTIEYDDGSGQG